MRCVNMAGDAL